MRLLDADEQRWYCYTDDQIYYAKEQSWERKVEEVFPQITAEPKELKELTTRGKVLRLLAIMVVGMGVTVIGTSLGFPREIVVPLTGAATIVPISQTLSSGRRRTVRRRICPLHQFGMSYDATKNRYVCPKCETSSLV